MITNNDIYKRYKFAKQCFDLRPNIRFQNWEIGQYHKMFNEIPRFSWLKNNQFLRRSIENKNITELRLDLDLKDKGIKNLDLNIKTSLEICNKFKDLSYSLYYSSGSGMHLHLLFNVNDINSLKYSDIKINCSAYRVEWDYIQKCNLDKTKIDSTKTKNYNLIENQSNERKKLKECICRHYNILNLIDELLLNSNQQLTLEGSQKRDSKTGDYKIYIPKEIIDKGFTAVKNYINDNKKKIIINENYFIEINPINDKLKQEFDKLMLSNTLSNNQNHSEEKKSSVIGSNKFKAQNKDKILDLDKIKLMLKTFAIIKINKRIDSVHRYTFMVLKYCYVASNQNKDYAEELYLKYFDSLLSINLNDSIQNILRQIERDYDEGHKTIFMYSDESEEYKHRLMFTKQEFWDLYRLIKQDNDRGLNNG